MPTLDATVEAVLDSVIEAIRAETDETGSLAGVKSVVRGDRARPMPDLPSVWVVPQNADFRQETYGEETWEMPISIAALVKSDQPAEGAKLSQRLTARARAAAIKVRRDVDGAAITDITSSTFDPTARSSERNRTLFWTEATITVIFTVVE